MATQFTSAEWRPTRSGTAYPRGSTGSVLIGSFNQQSDGSILIACKSLLMRALKN